MAVNAVKAVSPPHGSAEQRLFVIAHCQIVSESLEWLLTLLYEIPNKTPTQRPSRRDVRCPHLAKNARLGAADRPHLHTA